MEAQKKISKKPTIDLFLKKPDKTRLPKSGASLEQLDYKKIEKLAEKAEQTQIEMDKLKFQSIRKKLDSIGMSEKEWKKTNSQQEQLYAEYLKQIEYEHLVFGSSTLAEAILCREVKILECQQKVCVDQIVPVDVDDFWMEGGGNTSAKSGPTFNGNHAYYYARVEGSSYWDWWNYHRRKKESNGAICFRSSTILEEPAKIRQIGINFEGPLATSSGAMANGLYLDGQIFWDKVDSYGDGRQTLSYQISIEVPGGSLTRMVPSSQTTVVYNNPPRGYQNYADPYLAGGDYRKLPPSRVFNINQNYPAGTLILIEAKVSHWIIGCGTQSFGSVWHNFDAQPFINFESCSWQWPS